MKSTSLAQIKHCNIGNLPINWLITLNRVHVNCRKNIFCAGDNCYNANQYNEIVVCCSLINLVFNSLVCN